MNQDDPRYETPNLERFSNWCVATFDEGGTTIYGPFPSDEEAWKWLRGSDIELEAHVIEMTKPYEPIPF